MRILGDTVYTSVEVTPGVSTSLPSTRNVECRPYIANFLSHCFSNTLLATNAYDVQRITTQRAVIFTLPPRSVYSVTNALIQPN